MLTGGTPSQVAETKHIVGAGRRKNMLCPRCYSTDRDRLVYLFLKEKTGIFDGEYLKVLHIAPEGGLKHLLEKSENIDYQTGDKFESGYDGYYYDRDVIQMDVTDLPFMENVFDLVICNHVLEHIHDDRKAMAEILRVLKPGGKAILQVPLSLTLEKTDETPVETDEERKALFGQFDHVRLYGLDYRERLEKAGFEVELHNPIQDNWDIDADYYAINPLEDLYVGIKP
jgi:SAM-dependent methyltransferase